MGEIYVNTGGVQYPVEQIPVRVNNVTYNTNGLYVGIDGVATLVWPSVTFPITLYLRRGYQDEWHMPEMVECFIDVDDSEVNSDDYGNLYILSPGQMMSLRYVPYGTWLFPDGIVLNADAIKVDYVEDEYVTGRRYEIMGIS